MVKYSQNTFDDQKVDFFIFSDVIGPATGANDSRMQDLAVEKGTIHTKRHSGEDPIKSGYEMYIFYQMAHKKLTKFIF